MFKLLFSTEKRKAKVGVHYLARVIGEISDYWTVVTKAHPEEGGMDFIEFGIQPQHDYPIDNHQIVELYRLPKF